MWESNKIIKKEHRKKKLKFSHLKICRRNFPKINYCFLSKILESFQHLFFYYSPTPPPKFNFFEMTVLVRGGGRHPELLCGVSRAFKKKGKGSDSLWAQDSQRAQRSLIFRFVDFFFLNINIGRTKNKI